jgi:hypothetical protein
MCTDVQGHAIRCMLTGEEMDDVWCTSVRRLVRRQKRFLHEEQESGNSARLTLSRLDTVATQPGTARATAILGSAHPTRHRLRKGGGRITEKRFLWLVSGSFHRVLTCGISALRASGPVLDRRFLHSVHHGRCASITHSVRVAYACYFRTCTGCIWAMDLRRSIPAVS